jgi:hypothetical protein
MNAINIALVVATLMVAVIYRFMLENKLYVKRNVRMHWIFFGVTVALAVATLFIPVHLYVLLMVHALNWMFMAVSYLVYQRGHISKVKGIIYEAGVTLMNIPDEMVAFREVFNGSGNNEVSPDKKERRPVVHSLSPLRKSGKIVPVLMHVFRFRMSATANRQQYEVLIESLENAFPEYLWDGMRDGKWYTLTACLHFDEHVEWKSLLGISNFLPWYVVPLGVISDVTLASKTNSMYVLKLHETPQFEEQTFDLALKRNKKAVKDPKYLKPSHDMTFSDLLRTKELQSNEFIRANKSASMAMVVGQNEDQRNSILKSIIGHMVMKGGVEVYIDNQNQNPQFDALESAPQIKYIARNVSESYEVVKRLLYMMTQRYNALKKLNIQSLPLSGVINLGTRVALNNHILGANERVHVRIAGDEKDIVAQDIQPGMEVVLEGDKRFRIPNHWEIATQNVIQLGGEMSLPPVVFVVTDYEKLIETDEKAAVDDDEMQGIVGGSVSKGVMVNEIKIAMETITKYGKSVNVHVVFSSLKVSGKTFPLSLRDNIDFRVAVGPVPADVSQIAMCDSSGTQVPDHSDYTLSLLVNYGKKDLWKLLWADSMDVLDQAGLGKKMLKMVKKGKVLKQNQLKNLSFERYDDMLPEYMAKGVKADYGLAGVRREVSRVEGEMVKIGGKEIRLNDSARFLHSEMQLQGLHGDLIEKEKIGTAVLPEVPDFFAPNYAGPDAILSMEEILELEPDLPLVKDEGRVDDDKGIMIVGDTTTLNSVYSKPVANDDDLFEIVK